MMDLEYLKQFRENKEIADIIFEIEKLDCLVSQEKWNEGAQHLQDVSINHIAEKAVYNVANPSPPQSIQQSAANCRQFLLALGVEKIAKKLSKHLGGN